MKSEENEEPNAAVDEGSTPDPQGGNPPPPPAEADAPPPASTAEAELEKWRNLALRSKADLENYRKRMAREKSEAITASWLKCNFMLPTPITRCSL